MMASANLGEEAAYLRRSLEDLEREHAVGDLSDEDFARLGERYRVQLAEVEEELDRAPGPVAVATSASVGGAPGSGVHRSLLSRRRARIVTGGGALACLLAAATLIGLALTHTGPFAPTNELSVDARVQIMLAEADVLGSRGDVTQALATYDRVLALRPTQPVALANGGWLARLAGLSQHEPALVRNGDAEIEAAVRADPSYALAHAYDGVLQLEDRHDPTLAVQQFRAMLSDAPSATLLWSVRVPARRAFVAAGKPVPRAISRVRKPAVSGQ
jgi:tetratricopeptide (TPR) repeat protein